MLNERALLQVDVRLLKTQIWSKLTDAREESADDARVASVKSFSETVQAVPAALPGTMAKDVSVPLCFVCLLHLANEKGLSIVNDGDALQDLRISQ